ncbi:GTP-binding protein [Streptomyces roseolilacinus]|uniref:ATP/GTP-binding protein n=1 Tax=Streptomyces roseolilacinus TaxID=66904 RepID=A0A918AZS2_9ACTN|nr:ATP/GTP-binding protein [Streptomyces roseolilacinus]GGP96937.1 ATP/GTP-binding protein [Streptomyces roseolilacinus]
MPGFNNSDTPVLRGDERTVKILICGHLGAGKTTLVNTLSQIAPVSTEEVMTSASTAVDRLDLPHKRTTTVAMDFGRLSLTDDLVLYLFGAPGQERFFPILRDLATGALGALVLVDTRRLADTYPILQLVEDLDLAYTVAINTFDGAPDHPDGRLREVMDLAPDTPLVKCDAREWAGSRDALIALVRHLLTRTPEPAR